MRVGIVGIGSMGRGFAKNLLAAGFRVQGHDRDRGRSTEFQRWGGLPVDTPAAAASGATWVITSLPDHESVRQVALGPDGIAVGAEPGLILLDTSTALPEQSMALAHALAQRGVRLVDAPVTGTGESVMAKDVVVLAGGDRADFDACAPLFEGFCRRAYHLGPVGSGALGKLVTNVAVVGNRLALAEALTFGLAAGMDADTVLAILKDGPSYSRSMETRGTKMVQQDYQPTSTLQASMHGCSLVLEQSRRAGVPMFLTSLYAQIAQVGVGLGYGDADPASVIEALLSMSNVSRRPKAPRG